MSIRMALAGIATLGLGLGTAAPAFASSNGRLVNPTPVEHSIEHYIDSKGQATATASCPANVPDKAGRTFKCTVTYMDSSTTTVVATVHKGHNDVSWVFDAADGSTTPPPASAPAPAPTTTVPPTTTTTAPPPPTTTTTAPPAPSGIGATMTGPSGSGSIISETLMQVVDPFAGGDGFEAPAVGTRWVAVEFTISSGGPADVTGDINNDASVVGSDGQVYTPNISADVEMQNASMTDFNEGEYDVASGSSENGWVGFQIPQGVSVAKVQFRSGLIGGSNATWTVGS